MNSLGLSKRPQDTRVVVAMSGGVDSSVTAAVLREEGYDVVGITLQLYDHGLALQKPGACCAGQDIYDARQVADRIGIPHYVLDYEGRFSQDVMDDFADSYLRGETPIPCVRCNQRVKFRDLLNTARDLGADALATGHYVRRIAGPQGAELHRAVDPAKDQSYFLFATTREQLEFLRFPLGGLTKPETRALAERHGLEVAAKPDSQDICFVPNGNYAEVVAKLRPGSVEPGDIVHVDGRVLGRHKGVVHYTVGQRKGLGIGGIRGQEEEALYVVRLEPARRRVVVGPRRDLARSLVMVRDVNWLGPDLADGAGIEVAVKLRSAQPAAPAVWRAGPDGTARVELQAPQHGIAPGQACVVYQGDRVLGGGWISGTAGGVAEGTEVGETVA
ncbi:tRNA 2-thiouridine(34) synthase MnmA [Azospirillum humicireducens]|uniref:tRNA-specific 2-thiouridylase MnmA n=1 Tax=Azospirillum humicireducens TaxID=1226968 RepID=A0A160JG55_9PROT|nr:tRNA 2-thiouridine(34) synthase MnmA [Azospirillum humicireducens]ANC91886.1 tRNA 2-thiouridine(34) synthase MnmA [Azospirillum humicireducens]